MKFLVLLFFIISFNVAANDKHSDTIINDYSVVNNYYNGDPDSNTRDEIDEPDDADTNESGGSGDTRIAQGIALSLATNHPFDYATNQWQGSVNASFYESESALSLGLAKRFEKMDALWHMTYGKNNSSSATTLGAVWRF